VITQLAETAASSGSAAPWWAVPAGTICGAIIALVAVLIQSSRTVRTARQNQALEALGRFMGACESALSVEKPDTIRIKARLDTQIDRTLTAIDNNDIAKAKEVKNQVESIYETMKNDSDMYFAALTEEKTSYLQLGAVAGNELYRHAYYLHLLVQTILSGNDASYIKEEYEKVLDTLPEIARRENNLRPVDPGKLPKQYLTVVKRILADGKAKREKETPP
jgi:hypothetical protein